MSADDEYYEDDEDELSAEPEAGTDDGSVPDPARRPAGDGKTLRTWAAQNRGWLLILGLAMAQGLFGLIMLFMKSGATPMAGLPMKEVRDLAVEMLGHEVAVRQINQVVPLRGGKRMTIGLDIVFVLGQLPEEQVDGAPRPTSEDFALFVAAVGNMESRIRSRVNTLLQKIPPADLASPEIHETIKDDLRNYVNDGLEKLDFGPKLRPGIGKRRVTEVLLPMFVRQTY